MILYPLLMFHILLLFLYLVFFYFIEGLTTDKQVPTLLLFVDQLLNHVTSSGSAADDKFNIYEDFHMEETQKAKQILNRFEDFVDQLLAEFEEHPALLQVS